MAGSGVVVVAAFGVGATNSFAASSAVFGIPFMIQRMKTSITFGLRCPLGGMTPIISSVGILGIRDRCSLNDLQQITVRVACNHIVILVITSGQNFIIRGHQVIVVVLAGAMTRNTITFHNRRNVNIIRRHFAVRQWREQRLQRFRRNFETVIPHVTHERDDVIDLALGSSPP